MGVLIPHDDECDPIQNPDCGVLFEMGEALLTAAYAGLEPFEITSGPCAGSLDLIVSLGQPAADLCDVLFAWLESYAPDQQAQTRAQRSASGKLFSPGWVASWQLELWEAAYPTVEANGENQVQLPSPDHLHEINRLVYAHGLAMYHSVVDASQNGTLWGDCEAMRIGSMVPLAPQGGCAGWAFKVAGQLA